MQLKKYIYNVNYRDTDEEMSVLEIKSLFNLDIKGKAFISDIKHNPDISPFIKNRMDVLFEKDTFEEIIEIIDKDMIEADEFKVIYLKHLDNDPNSKNKRHYCKEVGLRVTGDPLYDNPKITYVVTFLDNKCYLGVQNENSSEWKKHNDRPYSYSSSLNINIAKVLVNLAGNGDFSKKIIDACCGVGTVLFEGYFSGYNICGRELNEKVSENARINLRHFNYPADVVTGDIRDITERYDSTIVDLPYGISVETSKEYQLMLIRNAMRISKKLVLVSSEDIAEDLSKEDFTVTDSCKVTKNLNREFARYIWICE